MHNSGWVQSPGAADLRNTDRHKLLEEYVKGVVGRFKDDARVQVWDVWNEPDNMNDNSYGKNKLKLEPADKHALVLPLLTKILRLGPRGQSDAAAHVRTLARRAQGRPGPADSDREACSSSNRT